MGVHAGKKMVFADRLEQLFIGDTYISRSLSSSVLLSSSPFLQ